MSGFPTGPTGSGGGGSIANPLPVSGPATNAELRATPLPVHDLGLRVEPGDVMVVTLPMFRSMDLRSKRCKKRCYAF